MPDILDVFNSDAFSIVNLTAGINKVPFVPGQVSRAGIFEEDGVTTTHIAIEELDAKLAMVAPTARGGPGEVVANDKRKLYSFLVPHFERDDTVMADEVLGVREFTENAQQGMTMKTVQSKLEEKMRRHARDFDTTLEHLRVGAIKGIVLDKNGNTMLNSFTAFGVSAPSDITFNFSTTTIDVRGVCAQVITAVEDVLEAASYSGIVGFAGRTFWSSLIGHKSVRETWLNTQQAAELRGSANMDKFDFGGIEFNRYRTGGKAAAANNAGARFIADDECRFVVRGVPNLFLTRFAPADYVETVNTKGLPRYMKQYAMDNNKGINIEVQTNPINLCTQPKTLFKGVAT